MPPDASVDVARSAGPRMARVLRVALVDDHHLIREGLRLVLEADPGIEIVGEAADHETAVSLVVAERPDVLLLDLTFPEGDALPLVRALRARQPDLKVVILTMHSDPETVRQTLAAGATGYIVKGAHSRELIEAIRAVARGDRYLHSSVTNTVIEDSVRWYEAGTLSPREREVLSMLASGHSPAQIGQILDISIHTVRRHLVNVSDKLGIKGQNALTRYAIRQGLDRTAPDRGQRDR